MHLFISYSHETLTTTQRIVVLLRQANHDVWFDERLVPGQDWKAVLKSQILAADALIFMISAASLGSDWCQWELKQAIDTGKPIVPIRLEEVAVPEPLASIQYVDFVGRTTPTDVAKLLGGLHEAAQKVPLDKSPLLPDKLNGFPSRAVEVTQTIDSVTGGTVAGQINTQSYVGQQTNAERVIHADKYVENEVAHERQKNWTLPVIVGLIIGLLAVFIAVLQLLPESQRTDMLYSAGLIPPSRTPTATATATATLTPTVTPTVTSSPTATATPTPERMPANQFNVVVAGFAFIDTSGRVSDSQIADDMSDIVYDSIRELPQIDNIRGWRANGVGRIIADESQERERQAAAIADLLGADVVIYGVVSSDGIFNILEPEFFVSARFASVEPELVGSDAFGQPVEFVGQSDDQLSAATNLQRRLRVLRLFLRGLALYIEGAFADSRESFEEAAGVENEGLEVLYVFAGNSALREPNVDAAFAAYDEALRMRPAFARALIGRGIALYRTALDSAGSSPPRYNSDLVLDPDYSCADVDNVLPEEPQLLSDLAVRCYEEAGQSQDRPATADIDVKVAFGLGQVRLWQSTVGYGRHWDEVETQLQTVLDLYEQASPERQIRIRAATAHSNAWLGLRLLSIDGSNVASVTQALEYYRTAVALLRTDINRSYNQTWINLYTRQVEALETWITENGGSATQETKSGSSP